ncbi:PIN domain-containing protein [Desulfococcaceae bacterium HSG8]|nr:PIN domain-containing protein [Desulfococcaceae bacterium HSG8]
MPDRIFVDTNIFIYAHLEENRNYKNQIASELLNSLDAQLIVSVQVMNEYYNVMLRNKIEDELIREKLNIIAFFVYFHIRLRLS